MFGIEDDFGDSKAKSSSTASKQYGRNQQYSRNGAGSSSTTFSNAPDNSAASKSKGGVLSFNDDSDSDDDGITAIKSSTTSGNTRPLVKMNSAQSATTSLLNSSSAFNGASDRPTTSSGMQSAMDRQRELLLNKSKAGFSGSSTTMSLNSKPGSGYSYGQSTDIDFNKLKTIVNENSSGMYEPGSLASKPTGLAPLSKSNNIVKFNDTDNNTQPKQSNIIDLDDDSDDDDDSAMNPMVLKGKQSQQQPQLESKKESTQSTNTGVSNKEKADALIKDLYGDSSDESEEDDKQAHERKLEEINQNGQLIGGEEDDDDEDEGTAAAAQAPQQVIEQQQMAQQVPQNQPMTLQIAENIEIFDMKQFLTKPVPKGMIIQTTIRRDKSGFARFYPKYHVHLSSGLRYLMTGKKRSNNKTSNYIMSMSKTELGKKSPHFLGKVRSNFLGTEFHVYDTGNNPKKCKNIEGVRKELAGVIYESNLLGARGPRKMKVVMPDILPNGEPMIMRPTSSKEGIFPSLKSGNMNGLINFINKPPKWNDSVQAFVLNFNGRVDRPSVKNFQLVNESNDEFILLQFGRIGDDAFNMDVAYPFSIMQAFGVCLSSFDYKIACE